MKTNAIVGIYKIHCLTDNKVYIGKSTDIMDRWRCHRRDLISGKHHSIQLQNAWDKYGEDSFEFIMLENSHIDLLKEKEDFWLDYYDATNNNYGFNREGSNYVKSEETILLLREKLKGRKHNLDRKIKKGQAVYQYDMYGNYIKHWNSTTDAVIELNLDVSAISQSCKKGITAGGFKWSYTKENPGIQKYARKKLIKYTKENDVLYFASGIKAARYFNVCHTTIYTWLNKEVKNIPIEGKLEYLQ